MHTDIREAKEEDIPQIHQIFEYYVLNTVISFLTEPPPVEYVESRFKTAQDRHLPYLVATRQTNDGSNEIVGYAYTSPFRGFMLGYGHSVEMTIFCHPKHVDQGIGGLLMTELLERLRTVKHFTMEAGHEDKPVEFEVKKVLAIMAVDETNPRGGLALSKWYQKWGFEVVGRLKNIGNKMGRDIDTMYLELELQ